MADENTARVVAVYALDGGTTFRRDFSRSMSNLGVLNGTLGQVRNKCSFPILQSRMTVLFHVMNDKSLFAFQRLPTSLRSNNHQV